jgi:DNA-binding response OmpR family regulator
MAKHILLVDDDELVLIALRELLKFENYEVQTFSRGSEALKKLDEEDFDLLILDISMPEMDGFELCKMIRKKNNYKDKPIMFLTAKDQEKDKKQGLEVGATFFISKPILPQKLLASIADIFIFYEKGQYDFGRKTSREIWLSGGMD